MTLDHPADLMTDETLLSYQERAKFAYDSYGDAVGWVNFSGAPMPRWDTLPRRIRAAWTYTVQALERVAP